MALQRARAMGRALAICSIMTAALAAPALVAAHGEEESDLGLDGIAVTSATVDRNGLATIAVEISCSQDIIEGSVGAELSQVVGRLNTLSGGNWVGFDCLADDGSAEISISFYAWNGKFAPGRARLDASAEIGYCTEEECFFDSVSTGSQEIRLGRR